MKFFQEVPGEQEPGGRDPADINRYIDDVIATMDSEAIPSDAAHSSPQSEGAEFLKKLLAIGDTAPAPPWAQDADGGGTPTQSEVLAAQAESEPAPVRRHRGRWLDRREMRRTRLVPLRFFIGEGVPEAEARAAQLGVEDVLAASGQQRELVIATPDTIHRDEYFDPDEQVANVLRRQRIHRDNGFGEQVDLQVLLDELNEVETYQEPHLNIRVMKNDLTAEISPGEYLNFAFGATNPEDKVTIQSIARFMAEIPAGKLREEVIRRLFRHETGHLLGLPRTDRGRIEQNLGWHCTNVCTMRQGMSVGEWAGLTVQEYNDGVHFCGDCQHDLDRMKNNYRPL